MDYFAQSQSSSGPSFCPQCGALLQLPETNSIACDACGYRCRYQDLAKLEVVTQSSEKPTQRWLQEDQGAQEDQGRARATVEEECPKCGHKGLYFYTMQLRSADEGSTVFYECPDCGHTYSVNN